MTIDWGTDYQVSGDNGPSAIKSDNPYAFVGPAVPPDDDAPSVSPAANPYSFVGPAVPPDDTGLGTETSRSRLVYHFDGGRVAPARDNRHTPREPRLPTAESSIDDALQDAYGWEDETVDWAEGAYAVGPKATPARQYESFNEISF